MMTHQEMKWKAEEIWEARSVKIDVAEEYGQKNGRDENYLEMQQEIERMALAAESYEHGVIPDVDAECTCSNPFDPACPACRARADLTDIPFEPVRETTSGYREYLRGPLDPRD